MRPKRLTQFCIAILLVTTVGCASIPRFGDADYQPIERGMPCPPIDLLGNIFALPVKLLLWNWKVDNHSVSQATEDVLRQYYLMGPESIQDTKMRLNQWTPMRDLQRLIYNKKVFFLWRIFPGIPVTIIAEVIPGRLFAGLFGGDHFNPWNNTIHVYGDVPAVGLHELGHSKDINSKRFRDLYALLYMVPLANLYFEAVATREALQYTRHTEQHELEYQCYNVLYPAYATYISQYVPIPYAVIPAVIGGHILGRYRSRRARRYYKSLQEAT